MSGGDVFWGCLSSGRSRPFCAGGWMWHGERATGRGWQRVTWTGGAQSAPNRSGSGRRWRGEIRCFFTRQA